MRIAAALLAVAAVLVAGCGSGSSRAGNSTDAAFLADMTEHHQAAIDMAKIAKTRAEHQEVRKLADDIVDVQQAEITVMRAISDDLEHSDIEGGHMGMSQKDMGMSMDPDALKTAKPFDRAFIDAMVPHHEGAISMAQRELAKGTQPALRKMAKDIISAQTEEIAEMQRWRKLWYGSEAETH